MRNVNKKNFMVSLILLCIFMISSNVCASSVLISLEKDLYPAYIKTPKDIADWFHSEGFKYQSDRLPVDEYKLPYKTIRDRGGDCEDWVILVSKILTDLHYKNFRVAIYYNIGKGVTVGHAICVFKEEGGWNFFDNNIYYDIRRPNLFSVITWRQPNWELVSFFMESGRHIWEITRGDWLRHKALKINLKKYRKDLKHGLIK